MYRISSIYLPGKCRNYTSLCSMYRPLLRQAARFKLDAPVYGRRFASQTPPKPSIQERTRGRLDKWITRSPRIFKPTLKALRDAPASYIVSFAVIHELTAAVPLAMLWWSFHHYRWLPSYFAEGKWVVEGVEKIGRWFRKRGWIEEKEEARVEEETKAGRAKQVQRKVSRFWNTGEDAGRLLVEGATAYAIVKLLFPLRIALSAWWAPAAARGTVRAYRWILARGKTPR